MVPACAEPVAPVDEPAPPAAERAGDFCGSLGAAEGPLGQPSPSSPSPGLGALVSQVANKQLRIQAVQLTDDNGGAATAITRAQVKQWVDFANTVHASANITFLFDDSAASKDFITVASTAMNSVFVPPDLRFPIPPGDPWPEAARRANDLAARYPNKILVLFRNAAQGKGFSGPDGSAVWMPAFASTVACGGAQNIGLFAHEVGHYLGLDHTFPNTYVDQAAAQNAFALGSFLPKTFDGDRLADTANDPAINGNLCTRAKVTLRDTRTNPPVNVDFFPPTTNVMSYYSAAAPIITPQQQTIEKNLITAGPHFSTGARFQLIADHTGKCLDIAGAGVNNGDKAVQWDCLGIAQTNQQFRLIPVKNDLVQIVAAHTNKCLDVSGVSNANNAAVVQWDCLGETQTNQLWKLERKDGNIVAVRPAHTNKCLDVSGASQANGAAVVQWDCLGPAQTNQFWRLRPVEPEIQLVANHSAKCLDVAGAGTTNATDVVQYRCFGADAGQQLWKFKEISQGRYNLVARHSNKCLDVDGKGLANGTNVWQWDCLGAAQTNQVWRLVHQRGDLFQLVADHSGKCLDVAGVGLKDADNVFQWDCLGTQQFNQLWRLSTRPRL
jgi:hypothetical protein